MRAKDIRFDDDARTRLLAGMEVLAEAVKVTMGPCGRSVMLEKGHGAPRATKDGVNVAKEIELEDRFANMGALLLREVADKANDDAGDGTTTAIVLAQAIAREGLKAVAVGLDPMEVKRGIDMAVEAADAHIAANSIIVESYEAIRQVGLVASNGDEQIAAILVEAFHRVGRDGAVTVEEAQSLKTELEIVEGIKFERGYISPYFVTDTEKMVCTLEEPRILLSEGKIGSLQPLIPVLERVVSDGETLLIVAEDINGDALSALILNRLKAGLKVCAVKAPGFREQRRALMDDLAALTGTAVVRDELGTNLDSLTADRLGHARIVKITKDDTTLVGGKGQKGAVVARAGEIRADLAATTSDYDREKLQQRLAALSGGVAIIRVGGTSEAEVGERKDRVEDAVNAVRAALAEGVVPGGGIALLGAINAVRRLTPTTREQKVGIEATARALEAPLRQIAENAGFSPSWIVSQVLDHDVREIGFDARTGELVNMRDVGILDPTRVVRVALRSAGSIAGLLVTTAVLVAELRGDQDSSN